MVSLDIARQQTEFYMDNNIPVFEWGPPGIGKSEMIHQIAKDRGWNIIDFRAILRDPVDMRGIPHINEKTRQTEWFPPDDLPNEKMHGKKGILFLDELNAAHQQVQAACFGLVFDRKLGKYHVPPGWRIIGAGNRQSDRSAAQRMPIALANRFAHVDIEADFQTWIDNYGVYNCDPMVVGFIRYRPELIHVMDVKDERMIPTPRSWKAVSDICKSPEHLLYYNVKGLVGEGAASEFIGFVNTYRELPDMDDIISKPKKTKVPEEPSALYAVSSALGYYATRENFDAIMTYANRLGREYEIVVCMDATKRDEMLTKTKAYKDFIARNKDIQIGNFQVA